MHWFAIHTQPRKETEAQASLQREGIETFYPKLRRRKTIRRVRKWVVGPLFPRYLFARFDAEKSARLVKYAKGVANIVSFGGIAVEVDEQIIEFITNHTEGDVVTLQSPEFKAGDLVVIQEGPFQGLEGVFERELSGPDRVAVLLDTIAHGAMVHLPLSQIEKAQ